MSYVFTTAKACTRLQVDDSNCRGQARCSRACLGPPVSEPGAHRVAGKVTDCRFVLERPAARATRKQRIGAVRGAQRCQVVGALAVSFSCRRAKES